MPNMINLETYLCIAAELLAGNHLYVQSVMAIFLKESLKSHNPQPTAFEDRSSSLSRRRSCKE
jgi:hypothetical protein